MSVTVKTTGLKELEKALADLPRAAGKRALRRVGIEALTITVDAARSRAPVDDGALRDGMGVSTKLSKAQQKVQRRLVKEGGSRPAINLYGGVTALPHAHLVEFGTGPRVQRTTGRATGAMPARPFMRPAWDATKGKVLAHIETRLGQEIEATAARLARRAQRKAAKAAV